MCCLVASEVANTAPIPIAIQVDMHIPKGDFDDHGTSVRALGSGFGTVRDKTWDRAAVIARQSRQL